MKKIRENGLVKGIAVVLFVLLTAAAVFSCFGVMYCYGNDLYGDVRSFYSTWYAHTAIRHIAYSEIMEPYWEFGDLSNLVEACRNREVDFDFRLSETDGNGVETRQLIDTIREDETYGCSSLDHMEMTDADGETVHYSLTVALRDPPVQGGSLYQYKRVFDVIYPLRSIVIVTLALSVLLLLADIVFLCCAAGHRRGRAGITRNWADKIPLDLYAAVLAVPFGMCLYLAVDGMGLASPVWNALGLLCLVLAAVAALAGLLSLCTRVKAGRWWHNTILFRLCHWLRRSGRTICRLTVRSFRTIPLVWRSLLVTGAVLILLLLLGYNGYWDGFSIFLYFLVSLAILAAVGFGILQMRRIQRAGEALAAGRFETKIDTRRMYWDFRRHAEHLNSIGDGMSIALEQRMRSERLKTELITNVSHDIKTPLTSIINYVDLLQKPHDDEEGAHYLQVLQRQSARLKKLTEDLVEASKASTGNLPVELVPTNAAESVNQALGEYQERLAAGGLSVVTTYPEDSATILADGRLLWRVLDNLLGNVGKYALAGTRVYVDVTAQGGKVGISIKNISRQQLNVSADELMERFVRGDTARSTEGSGLGLNIARSLAELQHGALELTVDGDLFKAALLFDRVEGL